MNKSKITVGIVFQERSITPENRIYKEILSFNSIDNRFIFINNCNFWSEVSKCNYLIYHWRHHDNDHQCAKSVIPVIESILKISCMPDLNTCWHYDDKIKEYYILKSMGFPIIESYVFWNKEKAKKWAIKAEYPVVFKLRGGASSNNVILVKNYREASKLISRMFHKGIIPNRYVFKGSYLLTTNNYIRFFRKILKKIILYIQRKDIGPFWQIHKNYVLFQKFMPGNNYDTRIYIIGNRAFGGRRYNRKNDFRASGSGNMDKRPDVVDLQFVKIAFDISEKLQFQTMAYDFIYDEKEKPALIEISYTFPSEKFYEYPGYWDNQLNWHEGNFWPQYFQLMDLLKIPELKQPAIKLD